MDALILAEGGRIAKGIIGLKAKMAHDPDFAARVKGLEEVNTLTFQEHFSYQNLQAASFASGKITQGEAMLIYRALGEVFGDSNGGWAKGVKVEEKIIITSCLAELLGVTI